MFWKDNIFQMMLWVFYGLLVIAWGIRWNLEYYYLQAGTYYNGWIMIFVGLICAVIDMRALVYISSKRKTK